MSAYPESYQRTEQVKSTGREGREGRLATWLQREAMNNGCCRLAVKERCYDVIPHLCFHQFRSCSDLTIRAERRSNNGKQSFSCVFANEEAKHETTDEAHLRPAGSK